MKTYGEIIPNLQIHGKPAPYGVVNEREIRAVAGLMFAIGISTMWLVVVGGFYNLLFIVVPLFFIEFLLKVLIGPNASLFRPILLPLLKKQRPEYVGAIQKRFAWSLGLIMAGSMLILISLGTKGLVPLSICGTCLFFIWLESSVGLCVGCKIYGFLLNKKIIKEPEHKPACAGGVCSIE
jgi:hypothetical protein